MEVSHITLNLYHQQSISELWLVNTSLRINKLITANSAQGILVE